MKTIFLTSGPTFYVKDEEKIVPTKLNNLDLLNNLKNEIKEYNNLLFLSSSSDNYKENELYSNAIFKSLSLSGIKFAYYDLIDSRNWLFTKSLVKNSDLIIIMGGNPLEQIDFFNNIGLKEKIENYDGCILGISAGSINLASYAYCSQDDEISSSVYYRGLGITNINIEPHFNVEDAKRINEVLIKDSKERPFLALDDESFLVIKNGGVKLYGNGYYFKDGEYHQVDSNLDFLKDDKNNTND